MSSTPQDANPNDKNAITERIKNAKNHYQVLGVSPTATMDEIKQAYKAAALFAHPDKAARNGLDPAESEAMMKRIAEAKTILLDEASRRQYDLSQSDLDNDDEEEEEQDVDNDNQQDDTDEDLDEDLDEDNEETRKRKNQAQQTATPPQANAAPPAENAGKTKVKDKNRAQELNDSLFDFVTPTAKKGEDKDPQQEWVDQLLRWALEVNRMLTNKILSLFSKNPTQDTPTEQNPQEANQEQVEAGQEEQELPLLQAISDTDMPTITGDELPMLEGPEEEAPQVENSETAVVLYNPNQ